jgi:hypothetical protein
MIWVTSDESKDNISQWDLYENNYMAQPRSFCHEKKRTYGMPPVEIPYGLEQISRQWHLKLKSQLEILG